MTNATTTASRADATGSAGATSPDGAPGKDPGWLRKLWPFLAGAQVDGVHRVRRGVSARR